MAVEIDPQAGPVEARRDLLDMGRFAGAVIALDHHPAVEREPGEDGERGFLVELIGIIDIGHVLGADREGRHLHRRLEAEEFRRPHRHVRHVDRRGRRSAAGIGERGNLVHGPVDPVVSLKTTRPDR